jgi:hypothetical protein
VIPKVMSRSLTSSILDGLMIASMRFIRQSSPCLAEEPC